MNDSPLTNLLLFCIPLSLMSFGGGHSIIAGLQHQAVDVHHWLTAQQFTDLFAISRTSPGPTTQIVALIGWQMGGLWGAMAASLAIFVPSSLLVCVVARFWEARKQSRWTIAIEQGLMPVAVGLMLAGTFTVARVANLHVGDYVTVGAALAALFLTRLGAYPILFSVALLYLGLGLAGM